ncbi:MAG: ATP synthase I [Desulfonauticus sp. 38_4375]|nr:MAG: ATP synthase I [Desulfonauticus sp. 38_4375]
MNKVNKKVEKFLYQRNFKVEGVRKLVRNQIYLSLGGIVLTLPFFSSWWLEFSIGSLLGLFNFYFLAKLIQELVYIKRGAVAALLFQFYLRLFITGIVLFITIVYLKADIIALLGGLSIVLLNVILFGLILVGEKFKEA